MLLTVKCSAEPGAETRTGLPKPTGEARSQAGQGVATLWRDQIGRNDPCPRQRRLKWKNAPKVSPDLYWNSSTVRRG
ncbi:MAG: hypothetical protein ACLT8A_11040 [Subdoligranulum sp.]